MTTQMCMCGDHALAHVYTRCAKCACTVYVPWHETPQQRQYDDMLKRAHGYAPDPD